MHGDVFVRLPYLEDGRAFVGGSWFNGHKNTRKSLAAKMHGGYSAKMTPTALTYLWTAAGP